jgi:hypothetical protein
VKAAPPAFTRATAETVLPVAERDIVEEAVLAGSATLVAVTVTFCALAIVAGAV